MLPIMRMLCCLLRALLAISLLTFSSTHGLNIPRILLPYHPKIHAQFMLEAKGGCFFWRSTRPDVVAVKPIDPDSIRCSNRAIITSKSKYEEEQNLVIFAEDFSVGVSQMFRVTVDVVERISISTTTEILFVDASSSEIIVEGFNKKGFKFSTLSIIPFDWSTNFLINQEALRIIPFVHSKYFTDEEIVKLGQENHVGYAVMVTGSSTGRSLLTAKFVEPFFHKVKATSSEIITVERVSIVPSQNLYLIVHTSVDYYVHVIRSGRIHAISLPSSQYRISLSDDSVCDLDSYTSVITAKALGHTKVTLIDSLLINKEGIKQQYANIFVVDPDVISFSIDNDNKWVIEEGFKYHIQVHLH